VSGYVHLIEPDRDVYFGLLRMLRDMADEERATPTDETEGDDED
jgi:hypothetical protein